MRILLTGTEGWAIDDVQRSLRAAGHDVYLCSEPVEPGLPCAALSGIGTCPLDEPVDVVLTMRARPLAEMTRRETAVTCALRSGIPLVVAGSTILHPFTAVATEVVEGNDVAGIAAACARAVAAAGDDHTTCARAARAVGDLIPPRRAQLVEERYPQTCSL